MPKSSASSSQSSSLSVRSLRDPACALLVKSLQGASCAQKLWLADENALDVLNTGGRYSSGLLVSNRLDIVEQASNCGIDARWNDFDLSHIDDNSLSDVYYRVSKEKPLVHHLINQAHKKLKLGGNLQLFGLKNDGIKSYSDKAKQLFGDTSRLIKQGQAYSILLTKSSDSDFDSGSALDCSEYSQLRDSVEINGENFASKPGVFGWNKIDKGSVQLVEALKELCDSAQLSGSIPESMFEPLRILDLGCGYGYLSIEACEVFADQSLSLTMTDNNATALLAAKENAHRLGLAKPNHQVMVCSSDAGQGIEGRFDLILCNPPFHQGHSVDTRLTDKFLSQTKRLLADGGQALYVVNQFIGVEAKAQKAGFICTKLAEIKGFKILRLSCQ